MAKAECDISKPSHPKVYGWALLVALDQVDRGPTAPVGCQAGYLGSCQFVRLSVVFRSDSRSRWSLIVVILLKLQSSLLYSLDWLLLFNIEFFLFIVFKLVCFFVDFCWDFGLFVDCCAFATWARLFLLEILKPCFKFKLTSFTPSTVIGKVSWITRRNKKFGKWRDTSLMRCGKAILLHPTALKGAYIYQTLTWEDASRERHRSVRFCPARNFFINNCVKTTVMIEDFLVRPYDSIQCMKKAIISANYDNTILSKEGHNERRLAEHIIISFKRI